MKRNSLAMLIPVRHELVLTIDSCDTDFLELGGMAQGRKQWIRIYSGIRAEFALDGFAEKSYRVFLSTADRFVSLERRK